MKMKRTHKGLIFGFVPVYLNFTDPECPEVEGRNFLCELLLSAATPVFGGFLWVMSLLNPDFEPSFPIMVTGEVKK